MLKGRGETFGVGSVENTEIMHEQQNGCMPEDFRMPPAPPK